MKVAAKHESIMIDATQVASIYSIIVSRDIANAVADFCADHALTPSYEEFRRACIAVANRCEVMRPTANKMRAAHASLNESEDPMGTGQEPSRWP